MARDIDVVDDACSVGIRSYASKEYIWISVVNVPVIHRFTNLSDAAHFAIKISKESCRERSVIEEVILMHAKMQI